MLKAKSELAKYLEKVILRVVANSEKCKTICTYAKENYNIPIGMTSDYISMRVEMDQANEFVLFCLLDAYEKVTETKKSIVDQYYTMQEVKTYRTSKFEVDTLKFPLVFKVIQVDADQWIGRIDVTTMMKLRAAQLIVYNTNAQRIMQRVVKGNKEYYKISINERAVREIKASLKQGNFIPNALTLNIPMDEESDFYYDEEKTELVVNSLQSFQILDGYHRWLGISQAYDEDENFECTMELRITHWDDSRSQTFIWQEDRKTFMKKTASESLNMNNVANIIVERLNSSINCNMKGLISRNEGIIDFPEMAQLVEWFYIKNNKEGGSKNAIQMKAIKELTEDLNILTESNIELLEKRWDWRYLLSAMCVFEYTNGKEELKNNIVDIIEQTYSILKYSKDTKLKNKSIRKVLIDMVMGIIETVI